MTSQIVIESNDYDNITYMKKLIESKYNQLEKEELHELKESEARALTPQQYRWLMEGLSVDQPKAHKPVSGLEIV